MTSCIGNGLDIVAMALDFPIVNLCVVVGVILRQFVDIGLRSVDVVYNLVFGASDGLGHIVVPVCGKRQLILKRGEVS
ncbi:hypothetical protein [Mycolicibacterium aubagnense]|uniref:hypothetical protein n=1 Tax=Mycolicibacterium aubagnense TaxID=319707 RepID=UPI0010FD32A8|nr:hypothetical protein [Mycolicibacterium aubagnense]WGI32454.1 hypothetical protein QDT91_25330 [Mycolicibacterium aubagnense]